MLLQDNVLISDDGQALLADFGLSFVVNSSFDMSVSSFDGPKGTLNWMSPELFYVTRVSAEADVWAFGMTALVCSYFRCVKLNQIHAGTVHP